MHTQIQLAHKREKQNKREKTGTNCLLFLCVTLIVFSWPCPSRNETQSLKKNSNFELSNFFLFFLSQERGPPPTWAFKFGCFCELFFVFVSFLCAHLTPVQRHPLQQAFLSESSSFSWLAQRCWVSVVSFFCSSGKRICMT